MVDDKRRKPEPWCFISSAPTIHNGTGILPFIYSDGEASVTEHLTSKERKGKKQHEQVT